MRCKICQNEFIPSKYRPNQQVCSQPECQRQRQRENVLTWRRENPDYYKWLEHESSWRESRRSYNKAWKATHKEYLKKYAQTRRQEHREYMREYMRRRRQAQIDTVNREKS